MRETASRSAAPFCVSSSRRLRQASSIAAISCRKLGLGKYVPPKNGSPSGVMNTVIGHPPRPVIACTASMYTASTSGRSSRSTLTLTNRPVHRGRHLVVLEALVGHDVAPVAGRVADRQQHRHVAPAGLGERLRPPRVPVDRVVAVLAEVRRRLAGEAVHGVTLPTGSARLSGLETVTCCLCRVRVTAVSPAARRRARRRRGRRDPRAGACPAGRHDVPRRARRRGRLGRSSRSDAADPVASITADLVDFAGRRRDRSSPRRATIVASASDVARPARHGGRGATWR